MAARVRVRTKIRVTDPMFRAVVAMPNVRAELARTARALAATARALAQQDDADTDITIEDGTRPKGRTFSRVVSSNYDDSEWGTAQRKRTRALGRAAGMRV